MLSGGELQAEEMGLAMLRGAQETIRRAITPSLDLLDAIAADLRARGIPTVTPLPSFQTTTASGTRLYWRDDTHWNDAAIRLAAELTWREITPLLPTTP